MLGLPTAVQAKTNGDIFDPGIGWRAGVGYGVSRKVEVFGDFVWGRTDASELSVGNVASLDLRAAFADYTSYGMDGGMRYHFTPGHGSRPTCRHLQVSGASRRFRAHSVCRSPA